MVRKNIATDPFPSADQIAQALEGFVNGFRLAGSEVGANPSTTLYLFAASASTQQWRVDADYFVTDVSSVSGSQQWMLTVDGSTYTQNFAASKPSVKGAIIAAAGTNQGQSRQPGRFRIRQNDVISFSNNSASNAAILVVLEPIITV